jgi:hypothetical protein
MALHDAQRDSIMGLIGAHGSVILKALSQKGSLNFRYSTYRIGMRGLGNDMTGWGTVWADFDNDGDLDVAINQVGGTAMLLHNEGGNEAGHWLEVQLEGYHPGAVVTLTLPDGKRLKQEWHVGSSYLASEAPRLHFGLGEATIVDELHVRWVDGREVTLENVGADQLEIVDDQ